MQCFVARITAPPPVEESVEEDVEARAEEILELLKIANFSFGRTRRTGGEHVRIRETLQATESLQLSISNGSRNASNYRFPR
ncbi:hypothetical protein KOR42_40680 [Thalassoglobus neptunius]|uniref:Uncharacterized protein n=1 Tax=Thalassoglobus neptunius TaxID=1938619 RepID=A0A5C5WBH6_9PLAN|nr:hypothetical protein KOR42_40680 [Thalassoglobus neptunius]